MLKKLLLLTAVLLLSFGTLRTVSAAETATTSGVAKSDYVLPYPGILPNHPLYMLKKLRDQVIEMLVVDPTRKSEFYLLQSDKWLASAVLLEPQGNNELTQSTLDASSKRMADAVTQLDTLKQAGREVPSGTVDRINQAIEKHLEILDELSAKSSVTTTTAREVLITTQEKLLQLKG